MYEQLAQWWQTVAFFEKILWVIALSFSTLFLLQTLFSLIGFGGDVDDISGNADHAIDGDDGAGYQFFTIKNMIAFFTIFGWMGLAAREGMHLDKLLTIVMAMIAGIALVLTTAIIMKNVQRLKHSGTMQITNAIGQSGTTYLFIPAKRNGMGKVHIKVQGTLHELLAMTDEEVEIATGTLVKVKAIVNDRILLVVPGDSKQYY